MFDFNAIRTKTQQFRDGTNVTDLPKTMTPDEERLQKIADHISVSFGCNRADVHTLVQLLERVELPEPSLENGANSERPTVGTLVRFEGETVLVTGQMSDADEDREFVTVRGTHSSRRGSSGFISPMDTWTYATDKQIETYIEKYLRKHAG